MGREIIRMIIPPHPISIRLNKDIIEPEGSKYYDSRKEFLNLSGSYLYWYFGIYFLIILLNQ